MVQFTLYNYEELDEKAKSVAIGEMRNQYDNKKYITSLKEESVLDPFFYEPIDSLKKILGEDYIKTNDNDPIFMSKKSFINIQSNIIDLETGNFNIADDLIISDPILLFKALGLPEHLMKYTISHKLFISNRKDDNRSADSATPRRPVLTLELDYRFEYSTELRSEISTEFQRAQVKFSELMLESFNKIKEKHEYKWSRAAIEDNFHKNNTYRNLYFSKQGILFQEVQEFARKQRHIKNKTV